jgi:hypothetical protein
MMSDIFNPPPSPDFTEVECPECGTLRTKPCHVDARYPNCNGRQYLWYSIKRIEALRTEWEPDGKATSGYVDGWNDAIEAICERLKGSKAL